MRSLYNIPINPAVIPPRDPDFLPASVFNRGFRERTTQVGGVPLRLALERAEGVISTYSTEVPRPYSAEFPHCLYYVERIVKFLLWQHGGWKLTVGGPKEVGEFIQATYSPSAARAFDYEFMSRVYEKPFTVVVTTPDAVPEARENPIALGRHLEGCRVGFDLGASDRKSSAVIDGKVVFSEEVPWDPRNASDPGYHYQGVLDSIRRAAAKLPRLEAVGGSSAGVYVANRARIASLFRGVPREAFEEKIAGMFLRIRDELGVPMEVINDGEVTALAGSMSIGDNPVLGIALGSSQAAGYVDAQGHITGGLNELAFAPIDYRPNAPADEWSGDTGCGVQYFSQVGAIRVASAAGMQFEQGLGLPEKLVVLQERMQKGEALARQVYETLGIFLGYGLAHYADFYDLKHVLILGRVTTGPGGEIILEKAKEALRKDFPEAAQRLKLALPDESNRRVGQSIAAASLPELSQSRSR
ncbi:MAG TPA: ROK family protein [Terriglobia bacterium]|nr:ROK family protein [Terriglobia bacterium]